MVYLVRVFPIGGTDKVMKNCAKVPDACNEGAVPPSAFRPERWGMVPRILPRVPLSLYCLLRDSVQGEKVTYTGRRSNLYEYVGRAI